MVRNRQNFENWVEIINGPSERDSWSKSLVIWWSEVGRGYVGESIRTTFLKSSGKPQISAVKNFKVKVEQNL